MIPTTESVIPLAARWAAGDRGAGNEIVVIHDRWIQAYARRKALPWEDADDLAQMMRLGFLRAATEELPGTDRLLRWKLRARMRDAVWRIRADVEPAEACTELEEAAAEPMPIEDQIDLHAMMARSGMTDRQRRVVGQMFCGDVALDVAKELGVHPMTVTREWERGIAALRAAVNMSLSGARGADIAMELKIHPMTAARRAAQTLERLSKTKGTELAILPAEKRPVPEERGMRIVDILSKAGPLTGPVIQEMLGCSSEMTRTALRALMVAGKVTWMGTPNRRVYAVSERQKEAA